jgi:single-strand DNA-binding protein
MSKTNHVQLIGRIGQKPELITTNTGKLVCSFSLATSDSYKNDKGDKVEQTEWHNIVAFGKVAELITKYLEKGSRLLLQGKLQTRQYQTKEGENKYRTEIIADEVLFLDNKS